MVGLARRWSLPPIRSENRGRKAPRAHGGAHDSFDDLPSPPRLVVKYHVRHRPPALGWRRSTTGTTARIFGSVHTSRRLMRRERTTWRTFGSTTTTMANRTSPSLTRSCQSCIPFPAAWSPHARREKIGRHTSCWRQSKPGRHTWRSSTASTWSVSRMS
jgi:hypothetical protein